MALATRRRSRRSSIDIWPGFVDALSQLLMVIIFVLLVFTAGQFFLSDALSGRDQALKQLQQQVDQLSQLLSLERTTSTDLSEKLKSALADRGALTSQVGELSAQLQQERARADETAGKLREADAKAAAEQDTTLAARAQVEELTAELAALRDQLAKIAAALDASEAKVKEQQGQIADLGKRLNMALVNKVAELAKFRSEFFGRLRQIIGDRPDIHVVGDRFVFQSEVLFAPGSAELGDNAKKQLDPVITALKEIAAQIPGDISWVLRVDGHTDQRPIHNAQFASNWDLSAARAISVVQYAIEQGVPAARLAAAGFADNQPLDPARTDEAYRRNRRIELKLTER